MASCNTSDPPALLREAPVAPAPSSATSPGATPAPAPSRSGLFYGVAAYGWWALVPIYFKVVSHVSPWEVLAHRLIWGVPLLALLLGMRRRWGEVRDIFRSPGVLITLTITASLVACNWLMFIWAVANDRIVLASLGYFINPLVSVALGVVLLKERLSAAQWIAVALATAGVLYMTIENGRAPWLSLGLAVSFAIYGLLRKRTTAKPIPGLFVETTLLLPVAAGYLVWLAMRGGASFTSDFGTGALLLAAGVVTIVPLVWFTEAAKRLPLSSLGFLQYISPSGQLLLGVAVYGEDFTRTEAITFACIWVALLIYTVALVRRAQNDRRTARAAAVQGPEGAVQTAHPA